MASPTVGEMILYDYIKPPLLDGQYQMHVETDVVIPKLSNDPQPLTARIVKIWASLGRRTC